MKSLPPSVLSSDTTHRLILPDVLARTGDGKPPSRQPSSRRKPKNPRAGQDGAGIRVMVFGLLRELALYRAEVLASHGFKAIVPRTKEEAREAIRQSEFDVAVFTYTLPSETVEELAQLLREYCPDRPLIAISQSAKSDPRVRPDATVVADEGPAALVAALRRLTRQQ